MLKFLTLSLALGWLLLFAAAPIAHPYYQNKIQAFKQMKHSDLIFLGDSLTDFHNWQQFGAHHNAGIAGDTTDGLLYRLHYTLQKQPHTLILMIGINDLLQHTPVKTIEQNYTALLTQLKTVPNVIVLSVLPVIAMEETKTINDRVVVLNIFLKMQASMHAMTYLNLYRFFADANGTLQTRYSLDGVHLNDEGYRLWERLLKEKLQQIRIDDSIDQRNLHSHNDPINN